jgi:hypothetical protein
MEANFDVNILSKRILQRHPANNSPKIVEVTYANGRMMQMHYHNNGNISSRILRNGTGDAPKYGYLEIYSKKVLQTHPANKAPKITEIKYSNGRCVRYHTHNNGDLSTCVLKEGTVSTFNGNW